MNINQIASMLGMSKEQVVSDLAKTGAASEADFRRMVMGGDNAGLHKIAMRHKDRLKQDQTLMRQARYVGATIPENF